VECKPAAVVADSIFPPLQVRRQSLRLLHKPVPADVNNPASMEPPELQPSEEESAERSNR
jgi:hypothetical protein